ncbi:hypothetical protein LZC95_50365 [Pendulispora brunnea]|uniref:Uncharacterized protein n=1 Tax=Pendulispora brunnea TaxID=2905690 RepID=A0ABZ2KE12_9BACT
MNHETRSQFVFTKYRVDELRQCGDQFVADALKLDVPGITTAGYTEFVLDWFAMTAPRGARADARPVQRLGNLNWRHAAPETLALEIPPRKTSAEFLVDLCHSIPSPRDGRITLVLESEWGDARSQQASILAVVHDAAKVAHMTALAKVIVFASATGDHQPFLDAVAKLRQAAGDSTPWLCIDLPWWAAPGATWEPWAQVLAESSETP